jgi:hypothetical protein
MPECRKISRIPNHSRKAPCYPRACRLPSLAALVSLFVRQCEPRENAHFVQMEGPIQRPKLPQPVRG